jgi:hypothetical protein
VDFFGAWAVGFKAFVSCIITTLFVGYPRAVASDFSVVGWLVVLGVGGLFDG